MADLRQRDTEGTHDERYGPAEELFEHGRRSSETLAGLSQAAHVTCVEDGHRPAGAVAEALGDEEVEIGTAATAHHREHEDRPGIRLTTELDHACLRGLSHPLVEIGVLGEEPLSGDHQLPLVVGVDRHVRHVSAVKVDERLGPRRGRDQRHRSSSALAAANSLARVSAERWT